MVKLMPKKSKRNRRRRTNNRQKRQKGAFQYTYNGTYSGTLAAQRQEINTIVDLNTMAEYLTSEEAEQAMIRKATLRYIAIGNSYPIDIRFFHIQAEAGAVITDAQESANSLLNTQLDDAINTAYRWEQLGENHSKSLAYVGNAATAEYFCSGQIDITKAMRIASKCVESVETHELENSLNTIVQGTVSGTYEVRYWLTFEYDKVRRRPGIRAA